jgi:RNA polymerase sigma factor (TIGR02999 family)
MDQRTEHASSGTEALTRLIEDAEAGRADAVDEVMKLVYAGMLRSADRFLRERYGPRLAGATLEPAALVNETYLQLLRQRSGFENRSHFLAIATRVMLRVLADYERGKSRLKRGGGQVRVTLTSLGDELAGPDTASIDEFAEALEELERLSRRSAQVAQLAIIWGLPTGEIAAIFGVSERTAERDLRFARAWLRDALSGHAS